ncbi:MAG: polyprenyl synthetase family protein [Planctomycetota bacterium]|jgi:geranylgeranyl diphosphate synthase type II
MSKPKTASSDFHTELSRKREIVNNRLKQLLEEQVEIETNLKKAICYTLESPGKRVRGSLVLFCCELVSGKMNFEAEIAASALEMVHTYSLVHDDLPAMDNDELRRGQATCHIAFNEATAILAGDGLLTLAFEILSEHISEASLALRLIRELSKAAGPAGMIAGQIADLKAEEAKPTQELVEYIHMNKTAKMFQCAAALGALCGHADKEQYEILCEYGIKIGMGFQIADDILDMSATSDQLGKTAGKDVKSAKATYPAVFGLEKSKELAKKAAEEAVEILAPFGSKAYILHQLAMALLERKN